MYYTRLPLAEQRAIQRAAVDQIKRRKHAAYTAWHFEDKRRGLEGRKPVRPVIVAPRLMGDIRFIIVATISMVLLGLYI